MRKTQVALAALALVASSAALADVTVSGYLDAGVANSTGKGTNMASGLLAPNVLNLSGSEDLGNGMKAEFLLQNRFQVNDGTSIGAVKIWNQSYVGLTTEVGSLQIGKNVDSFWGTAGAFDVTGGGNMGSWVDAFLYTDSSAVFAENQVKYVSPNLGGLNVQGSYYTAGAKNDYSVGGVYGVGALTIGAGYANRTAAATSSGTAYHFGAGYDLGVAKVNAVYLDTKSTGNAYGFNTAIPVPSVAALTLTGGYYSVKAGTAGGKTGTTTSVGAKYALSKRTTLFANYQTASGDYIALTGQTDANIKSTAGTALVIGVGHSF